MKRVFKVFAVLTLLVMIAAISGGFSLWHHLGNHPDMSISINGEEMLFGATDLADVIGGVVGLAIAAVVLLVVVPLCLLVGIGLPLLIVGGVLALGLLAAVGVGAVVFSPLILIGLLLWLALRSKPARPVTSPAPAAPAAPVEPAL
ncbi:hypothetical protein J7U46_14905 [Pelomonas sp. V22]|uniref:hypothetical protein n=1 Tax=Pelomonas sp. V22 TaxID=2822139 RepID=UPI0024A9DFA8|nr:hypothetical protein [Pelomonas sp. V22]MDI4634345.1 hypothetical protein [Pelomonas sp. V22]